MASWGSPSKYFLGHGPAFGQGGCDGGTVQATEFPKSVTRYIKTLSWELVPETPQKYRRLTARDLALSGLK